MPNGKPNFRHEMSELEEFFLPVAEVLHDFARRHNLRLTKYYHQAPSWSFTFRHPHGGLGKIEVLRESGEYLQVLGSWWFDDYDELTRFLKTHRGRSLPRDPQSLEREMQEALHLVLAWPFGKWDEQRRGNRVWKATWTKEQFQSLLDQYEYPKIESD